MPLPPDFQFSQSSLQDFEICARRFELRYLQHLRWPAVESEPIRAAETLARMGTDFHRLVHQHLLGIDAQRLTASLTEAEPDLKHWWQNYLDHRPDLSGAVLHPELALSTPLAGYRLLARFDLLAIQPDGAFLIIDWKTAQQKPPRASLARRIQSRVYPYVLAAAGTAFNNGQPLDPAAIHMMYWYPAAPHEPEIFDYDEATYRRDEQFLAGLIMQIEQRSQSGDFPLIEDRKPCRHCVYRSFCDRGIQAGPLVSMEEEPQTILDVTDLDWDQIAEIQF